MANLTFREQAAIALYAMPQTEQQDWYSLQQAVDGAQILADACCVNWGHQEETYLKVAGGTFTREAARCLRCGKETK